MNTSAVATSVRTHAISPDVQQIGTLAFGLLAIAYVAFFVQLTSFPYQDFPDHLTRAQVLADLLFHHGARYGHAFEFRLMPVPYLLGDVLLAGLVELLGTTLAGALWIALVLLSLPAALLFYMRATGVTPAGRVLVLLLSLYLATDWFLLMGFTQFRLGIALMLVTLACAHRLRLHWSTPGYAGFCALVLIGYFSHLSAVVFLAAALGTAALVRLSFRLTTLRREAWLFAPVLIVLGWHFGFANHAYQVADLPANTYLWGTPLRKWEGLQLELLRFGRRPAKVLMLMLAIAVAWGLWRDLRWRSLTRPAVVEMLALAAAFLAIYVVLPTRYSEAAYIDVRALALISIFVVLARVQLVNEASPRRPFADAFSIPFAALLAIANLSYLAPHLIADNAWGARYRGVIARIPPGTTVLPIDTHRREGFVYPKLHMAAFALMDQGAIVPYLFTGDTGGPMKYYSYRHRLYAPREHWYTAELPQMVPWRPIACQYQFILIGKPYDPHKIGLQTARVAENEVAALLRITDRSYSCGK